MLLSTEKLFGDADFISTPPHSGNNANNYINDPFT